MAEGGGLVTATDIIHISHCFICVNIISDILK